MADASGDFVLYTERTEAFCEGERSGEVSQWGIDAKHDCRDTHDSQHGSR